MLPVCLVGSTLALLFVGFLEGSSARGGTHTPTDAARAATSVQRISDCVQQLFKLKATNPESCLVA